MPSAVLDLHCSAYARREIAEALEKISVAMAFGFLRADVDTADAVAARLLPELVSALVAPLAAAIGELRTRHEARRSVA